ncbi:MAG TPA: imidazole glycerol phosphate synthase subunit HisH [Acidimicrobiia bacterium]|jgi:glutamine amidotransferase|nr:imidazole glycerol phosphate synthase subunit HisH [Acidimicrobiia bacterium]
MAPRVAIIDYGMCNLDSVRRAFEEVGGRPYVTDDPGDLDAADRIVLPGVGAFADAMRNLRSRGLDEALAKQVLDQGAPFLGVCLGMQLMAEIGHEVTPTDGLGWIDGRCIRFVPSDGDRRVPHVGWNEVTASVDSPLFAGIPPATDFYFVHSFHVVCATAEQVLATTPYCGGFVSAVQHGHAFGVQFHPEKSQQFGLRLLKNFLAA